jgi:hypothetical protein
VEVSATSRPPWSDAFEIAEVSAITSLQLPKPSVFQRNPRTRFGRGGEAGAASLEAPALREERAWRQRRAHACSGRGAKVPSPRLPLPLRPRRRRPRCYAFRAPRDSSIRSPKRTPARLALRVDGFLTLSLRRWRRHWERPEQIMLRRRLEHVSADARWSRMGGAGPRNRPAPVCRPEQAGAIGPSSA